MAAIAEGVSHLSNYSSSADCEATLSCLRQLGVPIEQNGADVVINGRGRVGLRAPDKPLDCGNSGTTMRLLAGILAGQSFKSILTGDQSLQSRPMQRIIEPLEMMGARISSAGGRAPLQIEGRQPLAAIDYELLVASAQVKSCILLAGLNANGRTVVIENEATRDHTERMLQLFGAAIETGVPQREPNGARFAAVAGPARLRGCSVSIPGDISSAAYFIAAATLLEGSSLELTQVGINRTRTGFLEQLRALGFEVAVTNTSEESNEPVGTVSVRGEKPKRDLSSPFMIQGSLVPQLIDELPLLAVVGSQVAGGLEIRGAKELRVKESDRIAATVQNLRAMKAEVEEFDDGMRVAGRTKLRGAQIDPRGDHRIAMAFTVAALLAEGETEIRDDACVAVSFPEFFGLLSSVVENSTPSRALRGTKHHMNRRIVLVGFMGCGKTTVGQKLARELKCSFVDLDSLIAEQEGRPAADIIGSDGEASFREIEALALRHVLEDLDARVIALGGGAWTIPANRALVDVHDCLSVWLDAPFELCWKRIAMSTKTVRPMAPDAETAKKRFDARRVDYASAEKHIFVREADRAKSIVEQILKQS